MRKTYLFAGLMLFVAAIFAGCTGDEPVATTAPTTKAPTTAPPATTAAPVALPTYSGTLYVAGHGGHFAVAKVAIDPSDTTTPIVVKKLTKIDIGTTATHKTHDARIDYGTDNLYWSTYLLDESGDTPSLHVGVSDLVTGNVINDIAFPMPEGTDTKPWYCGSGQSDTKYIPVSMSIKGYLDIWDKAKLATGSAEADALDYRVMLDGAQGNADFGTDYKFFHGTNTPDGSKMLLTANRMGADGFTGNIDLYYLDMADLEKGTVNVLQENRITGTVGKTITFRQYFTNDGTKILQSGADSLFLIDAKTLEVLDQEMNVGGDNHDAMPTPDDKYAVITVRVADAEGMAKDGQVQLYDIENKEIIGEPASVCAMCHPDGSTLVLCGLDGLLTVD